MIEKLEEIKHRFEEVGQLIVQPDIVSDMKKYGELNKEYKDLEKIVLKYDQFAMGKLDRMQRTFDFVLPELQSVAFHVCKAM